MKTIRQLIEKTFFSPDDSFCPTMLFCPALRYVNEAYWARGLSKYRVWITRILDLPVHNLFCLLYVDLGKQ